MMITNGSITVYHYNPDDGTYNLRVYKSASIYKGKRITVRGSGFVDDSFLRIRIPTTEEIPISTDDYVFNGKTDAPIDKNSCLKVMGFGDNRRGCLPHWRIECGQKYRR